MTSEAKYPQALDKLKGALYRFKSNPAFEKHSKERDQVYERYGKVFSQANLTNLV